MLDRVRSATSSPFRGTMLAYRAHPAHEAIERSADSPGAPAWSVIAEAAATRSPWWHGRFTCRRMRYQIAHCLPTKSFSRIQQCSWGVCGPATCARQAVMGVGGSRGAGAHARANLDEHLSWWQHVKLAWRRGRYLGGLARSRAPTISISRHLDEVNCSCYPFTK